MHVYPLYIKQDRRFCVQIYHESLENIKHTTIHIQIITRKRFYYLYNEIPKNFNCSSKSYATCASNLLAEIQGASNITVPVSLSQRTTKASTVI